MELLEAFQWLEQGWRRQRVLLSLKQPLTAKQLVSLVGMSLEACIAIIRELRAYDVISCLNPGARRNRVYWLTCLGQECQDGLREKLNLEPLRPAFPDADWAVYGWACYSHRSAIIRALSQPLQPATIKRRALLLDPEVRISANNVRDALKPLVWADVVRPVQLRGRCHPKYELTELGRVVQELLQRAQTALADTAFVDSKAIVNGV